MARRKVKRKSDWIQNTWRPMMGWQYMITCTFDFIVFPIAYALVQSIFNGNVTLQWHPITLEGAGLYHISMGAILGVTAWRGQEKMVETKLRVATEQEPEEEEEPDEEPAEEETSDPPMPRK